MTPDGLREYRVAFVEAMRAYNAGEGRRMRSSTLPYLIRHSAFHKLDHAWEMEDKDLSGEDGPDPSLGIRRTAPRLLVAQRGPMSLDADPGDRGTRCRSSSLGKELRGER